MNLKTRYDGPTRTINAQQVPAAIISTQGLALPQHYGASGKRGADQRSAEVATTTSKRGNSLRSYEMNSNQD